MQSSDEVNTKELLSQLIRLMNNLSDRKSLIEKMKEELDLVYDGTNITDIKSIQNILAKWSQQMQVEYSYAKLDEGTKSLFENLLTQIRELDKKVSDMENKMKK
jgi:hypothetical protein